MPAAKSPTLFSFAVIRALLAKDWRLFRLPLIALILVCAGCYLFGAIAALGGRTEFNARESLFDWATGACDLTALLAAVFGGIAIAGERSDRTADFIALLPVTRKQIVFSKLTMCILMLGSPALIQLLILRLLETPRIMQQWHSAAPWMMAATIWMAFSISFFSVAWLLSAFSRSGPISSCVSIALTIAVFFLSEIYWQGAGSADFWDRTMQLALAPLLIGSTTLVTGTVYYLRRIAP